MSLLAGAMPPLRHVAVQIRGYDVYVDLRHTSSQGLLAGSPWDAAPIESGEQLVMARFVDRGNRVFDIGANIGLHTVLFATLVGPQGLVFAFEPNPMLLPCLSRTIAAMPNARLLPFALSSTIGSADFYVPRDHTLGSLADWTRGRIRKRANSFVCDQQTIDDLVARQVIPVPDFIKCDVEGAELKVFVGARQTLDHEDAPIVLFESNIYTSAGFGIDKNAARDFLGSLARARYRFFCANPIGQLADCPLETEHINFFAVPRSKLFKVECSASMH